ncbi:MAG: hypothetical protein Q8L07_13155 [Sediminibacterium sp.]|nr:hypothetical protein [Sediminibacterium sp.]
MLRYTSIKQLILSGTFLFILLDGSSQSNVSIRLLREYPPEVTRKVYLNLVSKVLSNEQLQLWLADQYRWQDSLLNALFILDDNITARKINRVKDSTDWLIESRLRNQLGEKELASFLKSKENERPFTIPVLNGIVYMDTEMDSQFGKAIQIGNSLNLKDSQYVNLIYAARDLRGKIDYFKAHPDSGYFDRPAYESEKLSRILSEIQYNDLLIHLNKEECVLKAKYAWHDIKASGLAKKFNPDATIKQLTMYYLLREHILSRYANEKEKRSQMLGALRTPEPLISLQEAKVAVRAKLSKYAW